MSRPAIIVENLSKKFRIGTGGGPGYHRLSEALTGLPRFAMRAARGWFDSPLPPPASRLPPPADFWALKDVSFEVQPGEVVGIIGRNGAGKSTLLKILSRITEPTSGRFGVRGRVASLLEVGTGFHPELTGRENIFVSGITLGMTRAEIKKRFGEIVDFSGVEKFLDTPVKHYSSGMQVRLGFAVAAHLESEILIIDEVLAVGDAEFQKKCLQKMGCVSSLGRTLLFVSHNVAAIRSLCHRALWLDKGQVIEHDRSSPVVERYVNQACKPVTERTWAEPESAPGTAHVRLKRIAIDSDCAGATSIGRPFQITIQFWILDEKIGVYPSVVIKTMDDTVVLNTMPQRFTQESPMRKGIQTFQCCIPARYFNDERYVIQLYFIRRDYTCECRLDDILTFELVDDLARDGWHGKWTGVVRPDFEWKWSTTETERSA